MLRKVCFSGKYLSLGLMLFAFFLLLTGCNNGRTAPTGTDLSAGEQAVLFSGDGLARESRMLLKEMLELPEAPFDHVYSAINNWPTAKMYAARGVRLSVLLQTAGLKDEAKTITVKGQDDFQWTFTREQLLETPRYHFPGLLAGEAALAEPVETILAYQYLENSSELSEAEPDALCLIIPQTNVHEQTNQAFVKGVREIIVTTEEPGKWPPATVFPKEGKISPGDTVKLQHQELGKVKMYYTLDGSTPDENSALYNPSTYQPELNKPIVIDQDNTIKVLVKGFGKYDSDIAEFHF